MQNFENRGKIRGAVSATKNFGLFLTEYYGEFFKNASFQKFSKTRTIYTKPNIFDRKS